MLPAASICAALFWTGCASTDSAAPPEPADVIDATATAVASDPAGFTMDDHIDWLIGVLDAGAFDSAEVTERFEASFLDQVPVARLNAPLGQIAPPGSAPWRVLSDTRDDRVAEITVESADGSQLTITLAVTTTEPRKIDGLQLQPAASVLPHGYTFAQLDTDMAAFAPETAVGIYDVTNGNCEVIHEHNGDRPLAIGSIFKLWVLAELANQIHEGSARWDEPLAVRGDLRSNPAGEFYQLDDGDTRSLREYAEAMISISDNTATDHLIDRLGRELVETAVARAGVAEPSLNQPFLATRELFWLKYLANAPNPPEWYDADIDGRRTILASLDGETVPWVIDPTLATAPNAEGLSQDQPRNLDIEYFASTQDLCRTLIHLDDLSSEPGLEPVADILSINVGVEFDQTSWTDVRFKGGSEPGVFALAWWLERDDGRQFVVTGLLNDPDAAFNEIAAASLIKNAIDLI
jgi:hypothetical protein